MSAASRILRAVIDTNLIVSAFILRRGNPDRLIELLYALRFMAVISDELFVEYRDVLSRPHFQHRYGLQPNEVEQFFEFLNRRALWVGSIATFPLPVTARDRKDNQVLATALASAADYLITSDNDLLVLAGNPAIADLQIVDVAAFLKVIDTP
jgi:uncharacterized protein